MIENRRILIIITTMIFSLGMVSVGYGFWTDRLNLEGAANVKISINVKDDIDNVKYITPDAIQLFDVPMNLTDDNNSSSPQGNSLESIPAPQVTDQGEQGDIGETPTNDLNNMEDPTDVSDVINTEDQSSTTDTEDGTDQENNQDSTVQTGGDSSGDIADEAANQEGEGDNTVSTESLE